MICRSASGVDGSEVINHKEKLTLMLDSIINFISSEIFWWLLLDKGLSKLPANLLQHDPPICLTVSKPCWFMFEWWTKIALSVCSQLLTWLRPKHNVYSMATVLCWLVFILSSECLYCHGSKYSIENCGGPCWNAKCFNSSGS